MSTTTTFNQDQARLFGRLSPANDVPFDLEPEQLFEVLDALPSYAEFDLELAYWSGNDARHDIFHLMARDRPDPGRRFTCTTTGTEWFNLANIAQQRDCYAVGVLVDGTMVAMAQMV